MIARSVGRLRSGATLAVLFIVAACGHTSDWNEQDSSPNRVFAEGYRNLWEQYIHPVDLSAMSLAGLNQLKDLDPALDISRPADMVVLTADDAPIARWRPPDDDDFVGWARLTTDALMAARAASSMLRKRATNELSDEIFRGVMTTFDRYSRYADPQQARLGRAVREGFGGLGITISHRDGKTTIQKVHADTPAERVGLLKQDRITHVDRKPIDGLDQLQVVSVLRGLVNSEVVLSINRPGVDHPFDVSLVREMIVIPTVSVKREGEIVVVKISGFNQGTSASVRRELRRVERELGSGLKGIVLDLRDNPGGGGAAGPGRRSGRSFLE